MLWLRLIGLQGPSRGLGWSVSRVARPIGLEIGILTSFGRRFLLLPPMGDVADVFDLYLRNVGMISHRIEDTTLLGTISIYSFKRLHAERTKEVESEWH